MSLKPTLLRVLTPLCIILCCCTFIAVPQPLLAQTPPNVTYIQGTNTIVIGSTTGTPASEPITIADVAARVARPDVLSQQGDAWFLQADIVVESTGQLSIAAAGNVTKLRLESRFSKFVHILARQGAHVIFDGMTVTSWDPTTNLVDEKIDDNRAYVIAQDGARMDISNSELAYLGDQLGGNRASGVSWIGRRNDLDPTTGPTGVVSKSKFHHNYQGIYVSEGHNLKVLESEIYSNLFHGLVLRDGTQASEVGQTKVHDNVGNGIYLNLVTSGNTLQSNEVYVNSGGIVLERGSNLNIIRSNTVYQNIDGILIDESDGNTIEINQVRNNDNGIHIKASQIDPASQNKIIGNVIEDSKSTGGGGVYLNTHADSNEVHNNTIARSLGYGIYVKLSGGNLLAGNTISNGNRGIGITGQQENLGQIPFLKPAGSQNVVISNTITANADSGIRIEGGVANGIGADPLTGAPLSNNKITANLGGGVLIKSTTAGYPSTDNPVIGNVITGNGKSGIEVRDSGTIRNRLSRNIITNSGGVGIKVDGGAQQNLQPPVIKDILADGQVVGTAAANATIEVYSDPGGEGETLLGSASSNASGDWTFPLPTGQDSKRVTALVIDGSGNTSAFSTASGTSVEFFTTVTANPSIIKVTGEGAFVTLKAIQERLGAQNANNALMEEKANKVWLLKANLQLEKGVTLNMTPDTVTTLQLRSQAGVSGTVDYNRFVFLRTNNGIVNIDGVEITSWDPDRNAPDENATDGRSFISARNSAELNILNATISYLGMSVGKTDERGVTWDSGGALSASGIAATQVSGQVTNSKFHHNYVGAQFIGASDVTITGSEFHTNVLYGFYAHSGSRDLILENSAVYSNGLHGVVLERGCTNIVLRKNNVSTNGSRGILISQGSAGGAIPPSPSTANVIVENTVDGNRSYGIHLVGSSNNEISANSLTNNEIGVNLSDSSTANNILSNSASTNLKHGFQLEQGADNNVLKNNTATQNTGVGIYLLSSGNTVENNSVSANREQGIYLNPKDGAALQNNKVISNTVATNTKSGIEVNGASSTEIQRNRIEGNSVHGIYLAKGAVATKINNNLISANTENGIRATDLNSYQNLWSANSIFGNGQKGIDVREGANKAVPQPKITGITQGTIVGSVTSPQATIEIFADSSTQGRYFLGRTVADADGKFSLKLCGAFPANGVAATATDTEGNSSEFSATFLVPSSPGAGCSLYLPTVRR